MGQLAIPSDTSLITIELNVYLNQFTIQSSVYLNARKLSVDNGTTWYPFWYNTDECTCNHVNLNAKILIVGNGAKLDTV